MDSFATRIVEATEKEKADTARLEKYGCKVYPFGQALLPDDAREYLRKHPALLYLRWLSDLLVVRPDLQPTRQVNMHANITEGIKRARERNYVNPTDLSPGVNEWIWLVDSKEGRKDTSFWSLEKDAHEAHRLQRPALGLPTLYIWPDGCSCSYVEDLTDEVLIDGTSKGRGSGTPFWLVPKELTRPLDEVFGKEKAS